MPRSFLIPLLASLLLLGACSKGPKFGNESGATPALQRCEFWMAKENHKVSERCFETLQARFPGTAVAVEAQLRTADLYFERKDYLVAAEAYRSFAKLHPTDPRLAYVYYRAGLSYFKEGPKAIDRDLEYIEQAVAYFDVGMSYFPNSDYYAVTRKASQKARRRLADRQLYIANYYYKQKEYQAAIPRYAQVADRYQDLKLDEGALYKMASAYLNIDKKKKAFEVTAHLKSRYPNSDYLDKLARALGVN